MFILSSLTFTWLTLSAVPCAFGNGIIIVEPGSPPEPMPPIEPDRRPPPFLPPPPRPFHGWTPFALKSQQVEAAINDLTAETTVEQVFENRGGRPAEGVYLFAVAENAAVHNFTMWMNGREVTAELLDADKARQIYESIVARMRDPALLEYVGRGLIRARVFPIPVGGECRVKLRYSQPLHGDSGLFEYRFPLQRQECASMPIERFSLRATIRAARAISTVFSPSHSCSVDRHAEREVVVGLEQSNLLPDRDFQLLYKTADDPFGFMLLTHRTSGADGFFMARLAPSVTGLDVSVIPKNVCFVLDTSGSMAEGNKIGQAKKALRFCLGSLGKEDHFSLITFATEVRRFRDDWSMADQTSVDAASGFVEGLQATGGTDIDSAIARALSMNPAASTQPAPTGAVRSPWQNNPYYIVFVTDGEPTVGVIEPAQILGNVAKANGGKQARIFVLGVGYQVNTKLLDRLADDNGGARDYVTPTEDLEIKLSALYGKLANPILTGLRLAFRGISVSEMYPRSLPDLFKGSEIQVLGRYNGAAESAEIELSGTCRGESKTYRYTARFPATETSNDGLPRLWAMRKIGFLLDELRLHGELKELKDEVIRLSKQYGIMTPYTSFLVQEDDKIALRERRAPVAGRGFAGGMRDAFARNEEAMGKAAGGQLADDGEDAVAESRGNVALQVARPQEAEETLGQILRNNRDAAGSTLMNYVGAKTFYREGDRWVDAEYDGKTRPIQLNAYSKEYSEFLAANTSAGRYLAQGDRVLLCWNGRVYETVPPAGDSPSSSEATSQASSKS
jgi:Ca-activated chloride channel family protein